MSDLGAVFCVPAREFNVVASLVLSLGDGDTPPSVAVLVMDAPFPDGDSGADPKHPLPPRRVGHQLRGERHQGGRVLESPG